MSDILSLYNAVTRGEHICLLLLVICLPGDLAHSNNTRIIQKDKLMKARPLIREFQQYFGPISVWVLPRINKEAIVCYLRELGSAEGSVADTRDRKE